VGLARLLHANRIHTKLGAASLIAAPGILGAGVYPVRRPKACHALLAEVATSRVLSMGAAARGNARHGVLGIPGPGIPVLEFQELAGSQVQLFPEKPS
jgi:hypothetical protein